MDAVDDTDAGFRALIRLFVLNGSLEKSLTRFASLQTVVIARYFVATNRTG